MNKNKKGYSCKVLMDNNWIPAVIIDELSKTYKCWTQFGTLNFHKSIVIFEQIKKEMS